MPLSDDQIDQVIETLETATEENQVSSLRSGQVVNLPAEGEIWVTGDLHDHRRNFEKFLIAADLANNPQRHVVLHEMIHGEHFDEHRAEDSWQMLFWAADLKCAYASQVHFLFANHDLAQIHGEGIMKAGLSVCEAFNAGIKRDFGSRRAPMHVAVTEMLLSFPLAIRTGNGLFISHSIPSEEQIPQFDYTVFDRPLTGEDYRRRSGAVYQLVWGRKMSPAAAGTFADRVGARILITGHQPQEAGYAVNGDRHIIIASDHNQGVFLELSLADAYDMNGIVERVRKFVALSLPETEQSGDAASDDPPTEAAAEVPSSASPGGPETESEPVATASTPPEPELTEQPQAEAQVDGPAAALQPPPLNEAQRELLCAIMRDAFGEIRDSCTNGRSDQAAELAGLFQGLPHAMICRSLWDPRALRQELRRYEMKYRPGETPYTARMDQVVSLDGSV